MNGILWLFDQNEWSAWVMQDDKQCKALNGPVGHLVGVPRATDPFLMEEQRQSPVGSEVRCDAAQTWHDLAHRLHYQFPLIGVVALHVVDDRGEVRTMALDRGVRRRNAGAPAL